jgi:hypothetical protein
VVEILKLAYEFENSVSRPEDPGDETAQWFAEAIYEPTLLDERLRLDIVDDTYDLVLITGNPGDGKSAFLGRLARVEQTQSGRPIRIRHDATQPRDPTDRAASALNDLADFLAPLTALGWEPNEAARSVYVVGINKGLLVRAFLGPEAPFAPLAEAVRAALESGRSEAPIRLALVDLNERAEATLPLESEDSLFDRILSRLVGSSLWEERGCADCEDAAWCPFFANAKGLREGAARRRLKLLWLLQQMRSERHSTIRDLLAALAYVLVGHEDMFHESDRPDAPILHPCHFVEREAGADPPEWMPLFRRLLFNSALVDEDVFEERAADINPSIAPSPARTFGMAPELVRKHLNALDPSTRVSNDFLDNLEEELLANAIKALDDAQERSERRGSRLEAAAYSTLSTRLAELGRELEELEPSDSRYQGTLATYQWIAYFVSRLFKRRAFFASEEASLADLTRYRSLELFFDVAEYVNRGVREKLGAYESAAEGVVPKGIMGAEGRAAAEDRPHALEVRWSAEGGDVAALLTLFLTHPAIDAPANGRADYVEMFPERLRFRPFPDERPELQLAMSLEAFEALFRLATGYHEAFVGIEVMSQLRAFREALRGVSTDEMLIVDLLDPDSRLSVTVRERIRID